MQRTLLVFALLACGLQAAGQARLKQPHKSRLDTQVYDVTQNSPGVGLVYMDHAECMAKFEKDAALNRWTESEKMAERSKIPPGGYLRAAWGRPTIATASADNFSFLVESPEGKQVLRWTPQRSTPHLLSVTGVPIYNELAVVPLDAPLADGSKVFIIEQGAGKRFEYVIRP